MDSGVVSTFRHLHGQWGEFMKNPFKQSKRHTDKKKHACSLAKSRTKSEGLSLNVLARESNWGGEGKASGEAASDLFFTAV